MLDVDTKTVALATILLSPLGATAAPVLAGDYLLSVTETCPVALKETYANAATSSTSTTPFQSRLAPIGSGFDNEISQTTGILSFSGSGVAATGIENSGSILTLKDNLGSTGVSSSFSTKAGGNFNSANWSLPQDATWQLTNCSDANCRTGRLAISSGGKVLVTFYLAAGKPVSNVLKTVVLASPVPGTATGPGCARTGFLSQR